MPTVLMQIQSSPLRTNHYKRKHQTVITATTTKKPKTDKNATKSLSDQRDPVKSVDDARTANSKAMVKSALSKVLDIAIDQQVHEAQELGVIAAGLREIAGSLDSDGLADFDRALSFKSANWPHLRKLERRLGISERAEEEREEIESRNGFSQEHVVEFDPVEAVETGFAQTMKYWLCNVGISETIKSPLHAAMLAKAIRKHTCAYLQEANGMRADDARDLFTELLNGAAEPNADDRIYAVLGLESQITEEPAA